MKKKLEAELISIAHRILKLRNKSEVAQLHRETQNLYEKLSVLMFVEENFSDAMPTIGRAEANEIIEKAFDEKEAFTPETPAAEPAVTEVPAGEMPAVAQTENEPEPEEDENEEGEAPVEENDDHPAVEEPSDLQHMEIAKEAEELVSEKEVDEVIAEAEEDVASQVEDIAAEEETTIPAEENVVEPAAFADEDMFRPAFDLAFEPLDETAEEKQPEVKEEPIESEVKPTSGQIAFEDLLGAGYKDPVFVKPEEASRSFDTKNETHAETIIPISGQEEPIPVFKVADTEIADRTVSLNDRLSKGITVGLNDRIAFVKNLFGNSNEDYNRVLSQLITFNTFDEAKEFIDQMVKPDYHDWEGKDEYAQRFMEAVEKKFT